MLVVPEKSYRSSYLNEEPLDKSYDFISNCGQNSFYIKSVFYRYRSMIINRYFQRINYFPDNMHLGLDGFSSPPLLILPSFQSLHQLSVLPQRCSISVCLLQQRCVALCLPRGGSQEWHLWAVWRSVPLQAKCDWTRLFHVCNRLLGVPQLQTWVWFSNLHTLHWVVLFQKLVHQYWTSVQASPKNKMT